jgi:hypothetical protein
MTAPTYASLAQRSLRLFSISVMDQVVLSGANLLIAFVLIRFAGDNDYAMYVLVQSTMLLLVSMQASYLLQPLAVLTPRLPAAERFRTVTAVKETQRRILKWVALAVLWVPLLGWITGLLSTLVALLVATGILAVWAALRREYLRTVLLMHSRPLDLLGADAIYAGVALLGLGLAVFIGKYAVVGTTLALSIAGWFGAAAAHRSLAADPGWQKGGVVTNWAEMRGMGFWALTGATIYWFLGQSYSYILASRLDLHAVADVNATRLLLMPAIVMTVGVTSLLGPTTATWYSQIGARPMVIRLLNVLLAVAVLEVLYFVFIWVSREWILTNVLHKQVQDRDLLLLLWGGLATIALVRDVLQCGLIAMGHLKSLAGQVGVSAAVAVCIMWFGTRWWGASAVLFGQITGELINLAGILLLLRRYTPKREIAITAL